MTAEPVPVWARVVAVAVGIVAALIAVPSVVLGAVAVAATVAMVQRTTTFEVGPAPRLQVDSRFGSVAIVAARDGRIVVQDRRAAGSISRVAAAAAVREMAVDVSRQGDLVIVRQASPLLVAPAINRDSTITIEVPAHTDVDLDNLGDVRIQGTDGVVHRRGSGTTDLTDVTLRGTSKVDQQTGEIHLTNVTVAGSATVTMALGGIRFEGRLAPGGSALDISDNAGDVTVILPRPTDAHAVVTTDVGEFHPDGAWLFTPDTISAPRRWTADLGPDPTGSVTVHTRLGGVTFAAA